MGTLKTSKYNVIYTLGIKNLKSKGKIKVKEKNTKSESEDEGSNSTDEGSNFKKNGNKKARSKCTYCNKYSHHENSSFKNKMDIMSHLLKINNIDVPFFARREKSVDPQGHCNTMQFKGNDAHDLVARIKYVSDFSYFYTHSDIS